MNDILLLIPCALLLFFCILLILRKCLHRSGEAPLSADRATSLPPQPAEIGTCRGIAGGLPYTAAWLSERGGRAVNEDSVRVTPGEGTLCAVLADGLGGHGRGDLASGIAAEVMTARLSGETEPSVEAFDEAFLDTNQSILDRQSETLRMMTTAVAVFFGETTVMWGHVGDSRFYHFAEGQPLFVTHDHSVPMAEVDQGKITFDDIRHHPERNRLFRALGSVTPEHPELFHAVPVGRSENEAFLLCSDGFWELVYESEMEEALAQTDDAQAWLTAMRKILKNRLDERSDNFSAIAIRFGQTPEEAEA